ncbi:MAG: hypothetical protein ACJAU6_002505 [Alphaproteobacteria bacterium]|jgi:hypothetical protein
MALTEIPSRMLSDGAVDGTKIAMGADAQGDILYFDGADYVRLPTGAVGQVLKCNGAAAPSWGAGNVVPLQRRTGGLASFDFTAGFSGAYRSLEIRGWLKPVTDDVELWVRTSADGGASFDNGGGDYKYSLNGLVTGTGNGKVSTGDSKIIAAGSVSGGLAVGNAAGERIQVSACLEAVSETHFQCINFQTLGIMANGAVGVWNGAGVRFAASAINGFQLFFETGDIADGDVTLYEISSA